MTQVVRENSASIVEAVRCQVVEKQFCVDLKRQKARIYSPWKGVGGYPPCPLIQI
jgi:hypothetical protein